MINSSANFTVVGSSSIIWFGLRLKYEIEYLKIIIDQDKIIFQKLTSNIGLFSNSKFC